MVYTDIQGWFDFEDIYKEIADKSNNNSILIEIGVWKGRSICYLADCLKNNNIKPKLFAIDTWDGSDEENHKAYMEKVGKDGLYEEFILNIKNFGFYDIINPLRMTSIEASSKFTDKSVDFVFIDASHDYKNVLSDIQHWLPKIKDGGVIAGHDILWPDVEKAVKEAFDGNYEVKGRSWYKDVK